MLRIVALVVDGNGDIAKDMAGFPVISYDLNLLVVFFYIKKVVGFFAFCGHTIS